MKVSVALILLFKFVSVRAQSALLEAEASFPSCALKCMVTLIPQSSCNLTDVACICSNVPLNANISICATSTCTIRELLTTQNVSRTMCGAEVRDRTYHVSYIGLGGGSLALLAFLLRMWSRLLRTSTGKNTLGMDDVTMCILVALAAPPTVFSYLLAQNGLGKDMWTIPFDNITNLLYYYFLGETFYLAAIAVNKIVILVFIFRIFGDSVFRKHIYIAIALCAGYGISFVCATVLQCRPISYSWHNWDGEYQGTCNNIHVQGWVSAGLNIVLDLMVILLPMPMLFSLNLSWKKKAMVAWMFSLGIFVTIISIIRLQSLIEFANSRNVTWDYVPAAYWSTIELHLGIVCACLPAIRSLLSRCIPDMFESTKGDSTINSESGDRIVKTNPQEGPTRIPYSTPSDEFSSTKRSNFIPLQDIESQCQDRKFSAPQSIASTANDNWPLR